MSDPLAASRLPDLPNAGYSTRRERELTDAIMFLVRGFERERLLLIETVLQGQMLWRKRFIRAFRAIHADETLADAVFGYFVLLAGPNPAEQLLILHGQMQLEERLTWDKRKSSATQLRAAQRASMADLKLAMKRKH